MTNLDKYDTIFMDLFSLDKDSLNETLTYGKIKDWDSLSHLTLISEIEDTFNIFLETEDILNFQSYENGKKILEKYGIKLGDNYEG